MIGLNLLPSEYKRILRWEILSRIFYVSAIFVAFWLIIFAIMIFSAYQYLSIQNNALEDQIKIVQETKESKEAKELEKKIIDLNSFFLKVHNIQEEKVHDAPEILAHIAPLVPRGSFLETFAYSSASQLISLRGHANLRSHVVTLQNSLEGDDTFESIDFPYTNLIKSEDTDFSFSLILAE